MRPRPLTTTLATLVLAAAAACMPAGAPSPSPSGPTGYPGWPPLASYELVPVTVSTELVVGSNRVLVSLRTFDNEPLAAIDRPVELRFYDLAEDPAQPAVTTPGTFMETIPGRPGLYRAQVEFDRAGDWGLEVLATEADGSERAGRMIFTVRETGTSPVVGAQAPSSETPTATTAEEIAAISTDDEPDPDFYRASIAQALAADEPFLVVFATPAFCTTASCGPALDLVKEIAIDYEDQVTFIHVEPYQLQMVDGALQPVLSAENFPIPVEAVTEWGLPTEPYIFAVDTAGRITAKFEGVAGEDELRVALEQLTAAAR